MTRLSSKKIALLMLVIFVTNLSIWGFTPKWLTHEIEHDVQSWSLNTSVDQAAESNELANNVEHQLLHAVDHIQSYVAPSLDSLTLFAPSTVFFHFASILLISATLEVPFRPPRFTLFQI